MLSILEHPHPALRHICKPVEKIDQQLIDWINEMISLRISHDGIGLAANQVGLPYQIFVMDAEQPVFINPRIVSDEGWQTTEEGCLSLPGLRLPIKRRKKVVVEAYDAYGAKFEVKLSGLHAAVVQHELDHLFGILIFDKIDGASWKVLFKATDVNEQEIKDHLKKLEKERC